MELKAISAVTFISFTLYFFENPFNGIESFGGWGQGLLSELLRIHSMELKEAYL